MTSDATLSHRQQLAAELIMDDESLTGDLPDDSARLLVEWATAKVVAAAGDQARSDEQLAIFNRAVRAAVRAAAGAEEQPNRLLSLAEANLATSQPAPAQLVDRPVATPTSVNRSTEQTTSPQLVDRPVATPPTSVNRLTEQTTQQQRYWAERWIAWLRGDH